MNKIKSVCTEFFVKLEKDYNMTRENFSELEIKCEEWAKRFL